MKNNNLFALIERFREFNDFYGYVYGVPPKKIDGTFKEIVAIIVFKASNFTKPYTEKERSYRVTNFSGKAFFHGMLGNSIIGDCLDGVDLGVRLDVYNWEVEKIIVDERG